MVEQNWHWQLDEHESDHRADDAQYRKLLLPAIACSLLLHATLASLLFTGMNDEIAIPAAPVVKINFVPSNPLIPELVDEPIVTEAGSVPPDVSGTEPALIDAPEPVPSDLAEVEQAVPAPAAEPDLQSPEEPGLTETASGPEQELLPNPIVIPTVDAVRQTIQAVNADNATRSWLYTCNVLDEDTGLRNCAPQSDSDFGLVERNVHYEALNPVRSVSARVRSASTIAGNAATLSDALDSALIAPEVASYMREQLQAEVSEHTNNGTRSVQHMQRMVDRSDAAQQAERVLGDGWVRSQSAELARRRVQDN